MVAAAIRIIFVQCTADTLREGVENVAAALDRQSPRGDAAAARPPGDHRLRRLSPGSLAGHLVDQPLERRNKEVERRTDVVGIFRDDAALLMPAPCVLIRPTTSGRSPTAATCPRPPWPLLTPPGLTALAPGRSDRREVIYRPAL